MQSNQDEKKLPSEEEKLSAMVSQMPAAEQDPSAKKLPSEEEKPQTDEGEEMKLQSDGDEKKMQSNQDEKKPSSEEEKLPAKVTPRSGDLYTLGVPDPEATLFCNLALMVLLSLLYAGLTPWLLRRVSGQPTGIVWTCSLIASSYMTLWSMVLLMEFLKIFFQSSYFLLLALTATHYIGPDSGAAIAILGTFVSAGMLGYAIAYHRQRAGSEKSAGLVITPHFLGTEDEKRREEFSFSTKFMQGIITIVVTQRMMWLILRPANNQMDRIFFVVEELSLEITLLAWLWTNFIALILLEGALFSIETMILKGPSCACLAYLLSIVISVVKDKVVGLIVLCQIPIVMSASFGYCLAVYTCYKATRRFGTKSLSSPLRQKMAKLYRTNSA